MPTYPYQLLKTGNDSVCTTASGDNLFDLCVYQWYMQRWIAQVYLSLSDDMYVDANMVSEGIGEVCVCPPVHPPLPVSYCILLLEYKSTCHTQMRGDTGA